MSPTPNSIRLLRVAFEALDMATAELEAEVAHLHCPDVDRRELRAEMRDAIHQSREAAHIAIKTAVRLSQLRKEMVR